MKTRFLIVSTFTILVMMVLVFLMYKLPSIRREEIAIKMDANNDIKHGDVFIMINGIGVSSLDDSMAKKFGFRYFNLGCVVTDIERVERYNNIVIDYLSKRNGQGWYSRFNHNLDSINRLRIEQLD